VVDKETPTPDESATLEEDYPVAPEVWDAVLDSIPPWIDEIIALMLFIFGILSFLSVFDVIGNAPIAQAWSGTLRSLFGYGSVVVSAGILMLGVVIVLSNIGIVVSFPTRRVVALEIVFVSSLALFHLVSAGGVTDNMYTLARAGQGGGMIGWAISSPASRLFGYLVVTIFYSTLFVVALGMTVGIRREQIKQFVAGTQKRFAAWGERLEEKPASRRETRREAYRLRTEAARHRAILLEAPELVPKVPLLRIRPDLDNLPPSQRPGARGKTDSGVDDFKEHPLFEGAVRGESFNIIGEVIEKKSGKQKQAKRPDGRIKRYFTVGEIEEDKKVGRRRKAYPDLDLLQDAPLNVPDEEEINNKVVLIENTLLEFDIDIDVMDVKVGPTVTQFLVKPYRDDDSKTKKRTRVSKIASYQNDLALALSAKRLRIEAPVPGTNYVGVEVPNKEPSLVSLRSVYESRDFYDELQDADTPLLVPLGRDVAGKPFAVDLAALPHTLVAGTTGSGKSVSLAAIVAALLLHNTPEDVRMIMLDPKMVELSRFNGLPHLVGPVETDVDRIIGVLRWCTREMEDRYRKLEEAEARNIIGYNEKMKAKKGEKMPYLLVLIDEVGDLMMQNPDDTEHNLTRLAQMARAVGIHLVVATQRPSVDVLTGLIKANFPGRIAFSVASGVDSRVILDSVGAETLMGKGDMLFLSSDAAGPKRLQGCFVGDEEVRRLVNYWKDWARDNRKKNEDPNEFKRTPWEQTLTKLELLSETDDLLEDALQAVVNAQEASAAMLQDHLSVGFPRASRIMDLLFELGAIGPPEAGGKMRKVLIASYRKDPMKELLDRKQREETAEAEAQAPAPAVKMKQKPDEYYDEDHNDADEEE